MHQKRAGDNSLTIIKQNGNYERRHVYTRHEEHIVSLNLQKYAIH